MHTNKRFGKLSNLDEKFDWHPGIHFIKPIISKPCIEKPHQSSLDSSIHGSLKPVLPFLKVIHLSPLVSNRIEFDSRKKAFICKGSSSWKGVISITWLLFICMYISLVVVFDSQDGATTKAIIGRIAWLIYCILYFNFLKCFWKRGIIIAEILTDSNALSFDLDLVVGENGKKCKGNRRTWIVCIFMLIFIGVFVLTNVPAFTANTTSLYDIFMGHTNTTSGGALLRCEYNDYLCNLAGRGFQNPLAFFVVFLWFLVAYSTNFIWLMWLVLLHGWGTLFKYILERLVVSIGQGRVELIDGMALYTRVSDLIDKFNETFGSVTFLSVVSQGLYIALILSDFIGGSKKVHFNDGINFISAIPLFGMLYSASEVNRVGNLLPTAIKHLQRVDTFNSAVSNDNMMVLRSIQIARIIQYDSLSNNIGLKGMEYFTITYKFVASFIGVIATYSLISLQLTIGEGKGVVVSRLNGTGNSIMGEVHA